MEQHPKLCDRDEIVCHGGDEITRRIVSFLTGWWPDDKYPGHLIDAQSFAGCCVDLV